MITITKAHASMKLPVTPLSESALQTQPGHTVQLKAYSMCAMRAASCTCEEVALVKAAERGCQGDRLLVVLKNKKRSDSARISRISMIYSMIFYDSCVWGWTKSSKATGHRGLSIKTCCWSQKNYQEVDTYSCIVVLYLDTLFRGRLYIQQKTLSARLSFKHPYQKKNPISLKPWKRYELGVRNGFAIG